MPKVIMLVGLPASGKSTYAEELAVNENAVILSSDTLRLELYGNVNHQESNSDLFQELYKRAKDLLKEGSSVIIDATNINSRRRISFMKEFNKFETEAHYISKPYYLCVHDDLMRVKKVGRDVISKMYKTLTIPTYSEGWNNIKIISINRGQYINSQNRFRNTVLDEEQSYEQLFNKLAWYGVFEEIYDLPHDSAWHSLSVGRHTYEVWKETILNYSGEDKYKMLLAAIFHDTGKAFCKNFKEGSKYANFISHEHVSGQLTCNLLLDLGYDDNFILEVVELVQLHMRLLNLQESEKGLQKLKDFVGEDVYRKLVFLREADVKAH